MSRDSDVADEIFFFSRWISFKAVANPNESLLI